MKLDAGIGDGVPHPNMMNLVTAVTIIECRGAVVHRTGP